MCTCVCDCVSISVAMRNGRRSVNADRRERHSYAYVHSRALCHCVGLGAVIYCHSIDEYLSLTLWHGMSTDTPRGRKVTPV